MRPTLLIDGTCNLCHGTVRFVVARERVSTLAFASLQSGVARDLLAPHGIDPASVGSTVLLDDDGVHLRSEAALRLCRFLRAPWRWLRVLRWIPRPVRDLAYRGIAKIRYRVFGRRSTCEVRDPGVRARFLDAGDRVDSAEESRPSAG